MRFESYLPLPIVQAFDQRYRLGLSVDSAFRHWSASASFADEPAWTPDRPPEVRSTAFATRLPDPPTKSPRVRKIPFFAPITSRQEANGSPTSAHVARSRRGW